MTHSWVPRLLRWFAKHRRVMPWRTTPTPYYVWISEIMLQQTQVATVIPYFQQFIRRFPDTHALANARLPEVLKAWQGLGYYSRARHLVETARRLVQHHQGRLPASQEALLALPGIGPYTAAAIASIAFGQAIPAVDGNVLRVGARFWGLRDQIQSTCLKTSITRRLRSAIPRRHPSEFNQALMELGARVCKPGNPACAECPLRHGCVAYRTGKTHVLPSVKKSKPLPHYTVAVGVIRKQGKLLLIQRRMDQMLGGLWELPGGKQEAGESLQQTARREIAEETGLRVKVGKAQGSLHHAYSHFRITLTAFSCTATAGHARPRAGQRLRWVSLKQLNRYPLPRATEKALALVLKT